MPVDLERDYSLPDYSGSGMAVDYDTQDGEETEEDTGAGETTPDLDDFEPDVREKVEQFLASKEAARREALAAYGLDLNEKGAPVIADTKAFGQFVSPFLAPQSTRTPPPTTETPKQAAVAAPEPEEEADIFAMDAAKLTAFIDRRVDKATAALREENTRLQTTLKTRAASEASVKVRSALDQFAPQLAHVVDHPDFEAAYREQVAGHDPTLVDNPRYLASIAMGLAPWLDESRMPAPKPRDAQGRFVTDATRTAQREVMQQMAPSRDAGRPTPRGERDGFAESAVGFMRDQWGVDMSADEYAALGAADINSYKRAVAKAKPAGSRR